MRSSELILRRYGREEFAAGLDPSRTSHTVRVWQLHPIRAEWTAVVPVRPEAVPALQRLVTEMLASFPGIDGLPSRNAVALLGPTASRRGMRYRPEERVSWPKAP